jgi:hypothetical protein
MVACLGSLYFRRKTHYLPAAGTQTSHLGSLSLLKGEINLTDCRQAGLKFVVTMLIIADNKQIGTLEFINFTPKL